MKPQLVKLNMISQSTMHQHSYIFSVVDVFCFFLANQVAQLGSCDFGLLYMVTS